MSLRRSAELAAVVALAATCSSRAQSPPSSAPAAPVAALSQNPPTQTAPPAQPGIVPVPGAPTSFVGLVKHARASVVNIHSTAIIRQQPVAVFPFGEDSPFYQLVQPPEQRAQSLGTGFVVSADGDIITNNHVVAPEELGGRTADEITVKLDDKREFRARVLARDPATDVALLHVDARGLQPAELGDSDALEVGEWVVAIGEPYGLSSTVTAGIVSAKGRRGDELGGGRGMNHGYWDFIQTDAAINPGNSGGPLLNMRGEVVGINTAINAKAQGLAFAVPINMAKRVVADLRKYGRVQRGWLGLRPIDPHAVGLDLPTGALIGLVVPGSPAHRAGLRRGDVVLQFDGLAVDDGERLRWLSANAGVGKKVLLRVRRGEAEQDIPLVTIAQPD
ncbi:MAG TPA: trypsin-like peptidase domain-containing protein [Polyangia bacterium]|nr:trypsin-like peptidase domain-containing protein [Polyangia bacterium]